jgi:DNA-directed RNA polymerase subunit RPC12/RpoP
MFKRCGLPTCGRSFQVNRFNASLSRVTQAGKITCPHCGFQIYADKNFIFLTHALSAAQEAEFDFREAGFACSDR